MIDPRHYQTMMKLVRSRNYKIRYLAVAEYGALKGRVHFHAIWFGKGKQPQISLTDETPWPEEQRVITDIWPHGHIWVDGSATEKALRYACKYLLKNEVGTYWFSPSKKPPLGTEWFRKKARELVEADLMPQTFNYLPPGGDKKREYLLTGATRRLYLEEIIAGLKAAGSRKIVNKKGLFATTFTSLSDWVQKGVEKVEREARNKQLEKGMKERPEEFWALLQKKYSLDPELATVRRIDPQRLLMAHLWEDYIRNKLEWQSGKAKEFSFWVHPQTGRVQPRFNNDGSERPFQEH